MKVRATLINAYRDRQTEMWVRKGVLTFVIVNPHWDENITVESLHNELTFYFSYQHAHFDRDLEGLLAYIDGFLNEDHVVIEFFREEERLFGGARPLADLDRSSGNAVLASAFKDDPDMLQKIRDTFRGQKLRCEIRGWNDRVNKDMDFEMA